MHIIGISDCEKVFILGGQCPFLSAGAILDEMDM